MTSRQSRYAEAGVDVTKAGIEVFRSTVKNLFPSAFCVIYPHPTRPSYGKVLHVDGVGSKPVQSYLHFRETGDQRAFSWLAQDAIEMNLSDLLCVGARPTGFVDYVAVNGRKVPKQEFLTALNDGFRDHLYTLETNGIHLPFVGGETADLPDQLRTVDVSVTIDGEVKLSHVIDGSKIQPGDIIIGLRSGGGQTKYETQQNSGLQDNGITLVRRCLMLPDYVEKYPEIQDKEGDYYGRFRTDEFLPDLGMTVGEAIINPTRSYAPLIVQALRQHRNDIHGMAFNSGGGQTKILRIGQNVHYVKDDLPEPDPIFYLVQRESDEGWKEMHQGFNMGIGFDIVVPPQMERYMLRTAKELGIRAQRTGFIEESPDTTRRENGNMLTIKSRFGEFSYPQTA